MAASCGAEHTAAVLEDGRLLVWGSGRYGQLGLSDGPTVLAPSWLAGGQCESCRGQPRAGGVQAGMLWAAAGDEHTGFLTEAHDLYMCGSGAFGQLGAGDRNDRPAPTLLSKALFAGAAVEMVACGAFHTAALARDGGVWTWGRGASGQLGHGGREDLSVPTRVTAARFDHARVLMLAAGGSHTMALSEEGGVFTWGCGMHGRLGLGGAEHDEPLPRRLPKEHFVGAQLCFIAAGDWTSAAVTDNGQLYTWGAGLVGTSVRACVLCSASRAHKHSRAQTSAHTHTRMLCTPLTRQHMHAGIHACARWRS